MVSHLTLWVKHYFHFHYAVCISIEDYYLILNNNYKLGEKGTEKYYRQYLNQIYVKYANVNNDEDISKLKKYLLKESILNLLKFNLSKSIDYLSKYYKIDKVKILKSLRLNKLRYSNYLNLK